MSGLQPAPPPTLDTDEPGEAAIDDSEGTSTTKEGSHREATATSEAKTSLDNEEPPPFSLFSRRQKIVITLLVSLASVLSPMSATIYVPALPTIARDLDVSVSLVNLSVTSYMIFQGLSPSLWGSITDVLGRRPVYLTTLIIYIGACLGLAFTTNYAELIVFRCLQSTGSASTIAIGAGVIGDVTQRRERGGYIGFYSAGALVGNALGPILGGIFAQTTGWHGIFIFLTVVAGVFELILFLLLPETLRAIVGNGAYSPGPTYLSRPVLSWLTPEKASKARNPERVKKHIDLLGPLKMMGQLDVFCGLIFTALTYTVWQATVVATSSLFEDIYNLSEISIGLCFIANGVGAVSASLITGKILNHDYKRAQKQEKVEESQTAADGSEMSRMETSTRTVAHIEHARLRRAPQMIFTFLVATLAYGWCLDAHTTIALPILWTFFTGFTTTAIMSMFSTLIVDWYPAAGASATAAINLARCLLGAGGTAVIQPMIDAVGIGWTFTIGAAITIASLPFGILTYVKGEQWRQQRENKIAAKEERQRAGVGR